MVQEDSFEVDLSRQRDCSTVEFIRGPYLPGPIEAGIAAYNSSRSTISLQDMLDDEPIYFDIGSDDEESLFDFTPNYIWRYSGSLEKREESKKSVSYRAGSIMGEINILFKKNKTHIMISYTLEESDEFLFSLKCEL